MRSYLIRRVLSTLPVVLISTVLVFLIIHMIPGDPAYHLLPPNPTDEQIVLIRARYGFERPLPEQYISWFTRVLKGDLGTSISNHRPVRQLIEQRFGVTIQLALSGFVMALLISTPLGIISGLRPNGIVAKFTGAYTTVGFVIPNFWIGIMLVIVFSVNLGWLPTSGFASYFNDPIKALRHMILPSFTLSIATSVILANFLRYSVQEVARAEYITAAIAKGLPYRRVLLRHILPNAMIPVLTVATLQLGLMLAGTVITENLFSIPGLGRLLVDAISARDYAVMQGTLLLIVIIFLLINFITDLLYAWLDPRIRLN